jgi:phosphatidylglycerol:prolipoprotein diacylglycerol transferase
MSSLPIYFLILSAVYTALLGFVFFRSKKLGFEPKMALDLSLVLMVSGFIGGRLLHVFYENPDGYLHEPGLIFQFWQGGFVFYGGFFACCLGAFLFLRAKKESFMKWADFMAPVFALGYSLGRWSCFFAGCCYGRYCELPWAVRFSWDPEQIPRHPTQIYASLWEFGVFLILILLERKRIPSFQGLSLFGIWLVLHSMGRLMMEYYRADFRGVFIAGWSISSWISSFVLLIGLVLLFLSRRHFPNTQSKI